ncbi:3-hydroxyacyl-thioester dehydratase X isoform X2 [Eucyclogobius newberryi]|uniref:3-hydroxyacyl-thioester dehydratase X isoform X2 n=1 Tax=Eucyclogobius newberryi TaxID=166745 RepID=UPI003B59C345
MGNTQSHVAASLSLCTIYLLYAKIYCSYCSLRTKEFHSNRQPSFAYLLIRYLSRCLSGSCTDETALEYSVHSCRLDAQQLRRFCSVAGYGWDYPDSEYRDLPLCFPETLCFKLLLTLLTDKHFKLSPAGLVRVRQSIRTLQPIDELKKGPFRVRASVLVYRDVSAGVEVDIGLSATSRNQSLVWESVLTLLSKNKTHGDTSSVSLSGNVKLGPKQVELTGPTFPMMPSSDFSLRRLVSALCGFNSLITPRLWTLSVCLAELEKHRGVKSVSAPASVTAQFTEETPKVQGKVQARFWDSSQTGSQVSQKVCFDLTNHGSNKSLVEGHISRTHLSV